MVQGRNIGEAGFSFCRVNIKINKIWAYLSKYSCNRICAVWEITLSAIFNCLHKRILLNAATVCVYEDFFFVSSRNCRFADYNSKCPFRILAAG